MGRYLNPDNRYFQEIAFSGEYVDKTGLITYLNTRIGKPRPYIASSRPRRFGKSLAANMLAAYYSKGSDSRELFQKLEVGKAPSFQQHLNQYDVIYLDIQNLRSVYLQLRNRGERTILEFIQQEVISELQQAYPECVEKDCGVIAQALSAINQATGGRFVVIIDEWDCFFREEKENEPLLESYILFLRSLFKGDAPDRFIKLAYITGILPIKKYGTQSALNHFDELTMISPADIASYIGFTESEVKELCEKSGMPFEEMQRWYDGYQITKIIWEAGKKRQLVEHIYCPNSVAEAIRKKDFNSYWSKTETYESLKAYIEMNFDGLKDRVVEMLAGQRCAVDVNSFQNDMTTFRSADDVLTLLIHLGYLAYDSEQKEVFIPNLEVRESFETAVKNNDWQDVNEALRESDELLRLTWELEEEKVAEKIQRVHEKLIPIKYYNHEQSLATVIMLAYYSARKHYQIIRELESGGGFADVVFYPKPTSKAPAIVIELKWNKTPQSAIDQILNKHYAEKLEKYRGNTLLVGISYDKKTKRHQCKIEKA